MLRKAVTVATEQAWYGPTVAVVAIRTAVLTPRAVQLRIAELTLPTAVRTVELIPPTTLRIADRTVVLTLRAAVHLADRRVELTQAVDDCSVVDVAHVVVLPVVLTLRIVARTHRTVATLATAADQLVVRIVFVAQETAVTAVEQPWYRLAAATARHPFPPKS